MPMRSRGTLSPSALTTERMLATLSGGFGVVAPGSGQSDYQATVAADGKGRVVFFWVALDRLPYVAGF